MSQIHEWFNQNPWAIWLIAIIVILILLWLILRHTTSSSSQEGGQGNSGNGNGSGSGSGNNSSSNGNAGDSSGAGGGSGNSSGVGSSAGNTELDWGDAIRTSHKVPDWVYVMNRSIARKASRKRANGDQVKTYQRHNPRSMRFSNVIRPRTLTISKPDKLSVYMGVDTSGSMRSHNGSRLAVEAVDQILRQDKYETHLACIDTRLYPWQSAENLKNIRFTGGGGTYLSTFFKEVLNIDRNPTEETPKPDVAVLITDGELADEDWAEMTKQASLYDNKGISMFVLITDPRVSCPAELRNLAKVFHSTK